MVQRWTDRPNADVRSACSRRNAAPSKQPLVLIAAIGCSEPEGDEFSRAESKVRRVARDCLAESRPLTSLRRIFVAVCPFADRNRQQLRVDRRQKCAFRFGEPSCRVADEMDVHARQIAMGRQLPDPPCHNVLRSDMQRKRTYSDASQDHPSDLVQTGGNTAPLTGKLQHGAQSGNLFQRSPDSFGLKSHEGFAFEITRQDLFGVKQRVAGAAVEAEMLAIEHPVRQRLRELRQKADAEAGPVQRHRGLDLFALLDRERVGDLWVSLRKAVQDIVEMGRNDGTGYCDRQVTAQLDRILLEKRRKL